MHEEQERYLRALSKSHETTQEKNNQKKRDSLKTDEMPSIPTDDSNKQNDFDPLEAASGNSISQILVKDASRTSSSLVMAIYINTLFHTFFLF